jgi:uncharacterized protein YcbK (DUF882 family)
MAPILALVLFLVGGATDVARVFNGGGSAQHRLTFYFENRQEEQSFTVFDGKGDLASDVLARFSHFVRCWRTNRELTIHPRTLALVDAVAQHFGVKRIDVVSGYRARPYGAPHSKHFAGRALDLKFNGARAKEVAAWVWRNFRHVGVGYYPRQQFVHLDTRDQDVRWVDLARHGESASARYFVRAPGERFAPPDAPHLAYDDITSFPNNKLAALQDIRSNSFDPLQF